MQTSRKTILSTADEEFYQSFTKRFENVQCGVFSILLLAIFTYFLIPYSMDVINALLAPSSYLQVYLYSIPKGLLVLIIIVFTKIKRQRLTQRSLGLTLPVSREARFLLITFAAAGTGILAFLSYFKSSGVDIHLISPYSALDIHHLQMALADGDFRYFLLNSAPLLITALITAPIVEEIYFSGLLFATLRNRLGLVAGLVISSALFALHHAYADPFREGQLLTFSILFASQALSFLFYQTTRSLYHSIAYHFVRNLTVAFVELSALF